MTTNGKTMPDRVLTMTDPTRKDAGAPALNIVISYDPINHDIQVKGPMGMNVISIMGIIELAKVALLSSSTKRG